MTIKSFQDWVHQSWIEYKGEMPSKQLQLLFLVEEFGEVAEAIRHIENGKTNIRKQADLEGEMGDFYLSLNTVASYYGVDLQTAATKSKNKIIQRHGG